MFTDKISIESLLEELLKKADFFEHIRGLSYTDAIRTYDDGYNDQKNTHPQVMTGPYEIYNLLDIDEFEDDSGVGPIERVLRQAADIIHTMYIELLDKEKCVTITGDETNATGT